MFKLASQQSKSGCIRWVSVVIAALLLCLASSIALYTIGFWVHELSAVFGQHPSAVELIDNFHAHRAEFDLLLEMCLEDEGLVRVAYGWTQPEDPSSIGITQERLKEYRALFKEVGLESGVSGGHKDIWFHASSSGLSVSGSSKGYIYSSAPPGWVVEDLDEYTSKYKADIPVFQHIEGNWYLYYWC
jgi:hypothetical protein